jgi:hypothetical protein
MVTRRNITLYVICRYCLYGSRISGCQPDRRRLSFVKATTGMHRVPRPIYYGSSGNSQLQYAVLYWALFVCSVLLWLTNCNLSSCTSVFFTVMKVVSYTE